MWPQLWIIGILQLTACQRVEGSFHHLMDEHELHHIFGVKDELKVPRYTVEWPWKGIRDDDFHEYVLNFDDQQFRFQLTPYPELVSNSFHAVINDGNASAIEHHSKYRHCIYTGESTSHNNTHLSLVGCGKQARGMIMAADGNFIIIHPVPPKYSEKYYHKSSEKPSKSSVRPHIIYKRSAFNVMDKFEADSAEKPCLFKAEDDPFPENSFDTRYRDDPLDERLPVVKGPLTMELGLFADDAMWNHFKNLYGNRADAELQQFILASVNNIHLLFGHSSIDPKIFLKIVRYQVFKDPPDSISKQRHQNGEVDMLLERFCEYQNNINPKSDANARHWDHALLYTGYDLYRGTLKSVAGYAPVKGMCSGIRSCTINEGLDFGAAFVITHEMGHSLGMYHDGDNGCNSRCCIMSPAVGAGKTAWSSCSVQEFMNFIKKLGNGFLPPNCLLDGEDGKAPVLDHSLGGILPGQRYNLDQQCRIFHGDCWQQELRDGQSIEDVCDMVWCGAGEGVIRTTHPALDGSTCGNRKWCIEGKCVAWRGAPPRAVHGGWTAWNDNPGSSCGNDGDCGVCAVEGQYRVRRSIRLCENPAPNNGGKPCPGSAYRAKICSNVKCQGPRPDQYASKICRDLRSNANTPDLLLSGRGFQYEESACKVWCHMTLNNFIRSVANFPDGTPCGINAFCVKGTCQHLACGGSALVAHVRDCPSSDLALSPQRNLARKDRKDSRWSGWQAWSECSVSCDGGVRSRKRVCGGSLCLGVAKQTFACGADRCPAAKIVIRNEWNSWSNWAECDVTCGAGRQPRKRLCSGRQCSGLSIQYRRCDLKDCPTVEWRSWLQWTLCSKTCGGGQRTRRRECVAPVCIGTSTEIVGCNAKACSYEISRKSSWTAWEAWSECSRSCGGGTRFRSRHCRGDAVCFGSGVVFLNCNSQRCRPTKTNRPTADFRLDISGAEWSDWGSWSGCSKSCDGGIQRRKRSCDHRLSPCTGISSQTRSCNSHACKAKVLGEWKEWGLWRDCSCEGKQSRYRRCRFNPPCFGRWIQFRECAATEQQSC